MRRGIGKPPEGCTCILNQWVGNRIGSVGEREWVVHIADRNCPHHGTPPKDDLYDGRMPIEDLE